MKNHNSKSKTNTQTNKIHNTPIKKKLFNVLIFYRKNEKKRVFFDKKHVFQLPWANQPDFQVPQLLQRPVSVANCRGSSLAKEAKFESTFVWLVMDAYYTWRIIPGIVSG